MFKENPTNKQTKVSVLEACVPTIVIDGQALIKMALYVEECNDEIGWLGTAVMDDKYNVYIKDVFLFDQEVHSTTTEISPEGLSEFGEKLLQQTDGVDIWNTIKVWGHSHVNMAPNPSNQDDSQMETFANCGHDWFVRIIANKKDDLRVDLYHYKLGLIYTNLPWYELAPVEERELEQQINDLYAQLQVLQEGRKERYKEDITVEMKAKVKKKVYTPINNNVYSYQYRQPKPPAGKQERQPQYSKNYSGYGDDIDSWYDAHYSGVSYGDLIDNKTRKLLRTYTEVYQTFDQDLLVDIADCDSTVEVRECLSLFGINPNTLEFEEIELIWKASIALLSNTQAQGSEN